MHLGMYEATLDRHNTVRHACDAAELHITSQLVLHMTWLGLGSIYHVKCKRKSLKCFHQMHVVHAPDISGCVAMMAKTGLGVYAEALRHSCFIAS